MRASGQKNGRVLREFENRRLALIAELTTHFGALNFGTLDRTAIAVEGFLFDAVKRLICAEAQHLFGANQPGKNARLFSVGSNEYQINVTSALLKTDHLLVAILPHELRGVVRERDLDTHDVTIEGYGRYQHVTLYVPHTLARDWSSVEHVVKNTIETIYAWVHQQILRHVASETGAAASELYSYIRTIFLRKDVWRQLWFGAMSDGRGFRLFDEFVVASAFDTARKHSSVFSRGANDVVAEILNKNLPIEQLLMRNVIARKEPIEVNIADAAYHKQPSTYSEAMRSFYGSTAFVIYPIFTDVEYPDKVIALYPTALRSEVDPVLRAHRTALRGIAEKSAKRIRETLKAMKMRPDTIGNFAIGAAALDDPLRLIERDRVVVWKGKSYAVSPTQFECIRVFHGLAQNGMELVHQKHVLSAVTTNSNRLRDLFKGHDLFRTLIRPRGRGYFSLEINAQDEPGK